MCFDRERSCRNLNHSTRREILRILAPQMRMVHSILHHRQSLQVVGHNCVRKTVQESLYNFWIAVKIDLAALLDHLDLKRRKGLFYWCSGTKIINKFSEWIPSPPALMIFFVVVKLLASSIPKAQKMHVCVFTHLRCRFCRVGLKRISKIWWIDGGAPTTHLQSKQTIPSFTTWWGGTFFRIP